MNEQASLRNYKINIQITKKNNSKITFINIIDNDIYRSS